MHQDGFDERAVGEPMERLLGQAAVGDLQLGVGDGVEDEGGVERARARPAGSVSISSNEPIVPPHTASATCRAR